MFYKIKKKGLSRSIKTSIVFFIKENKCQMNNMNNMNVELNVGNNITLIKKEKKSRIGMLNYTYEDLYNFLNFEKDLSSILELDYRYTVLCRVCFINEEEDIIEREWKTLGDQVFLLLDSVDSLKKGIKYLHKNIFAQLKLSMEKYEFKDCEIISIQILIYTIGSYDATHKKVKFSKSLLGESKDLVNFTKISEGFNKILPLTSNKDHFGILLDKKVVDNSVEYITLIDGSTINFVECINKYLTSNKRILKFSSNVDFYQKKDKDLDIIITVENLIVKGVNKNYINIYHTSGMKIQEMVDEQLDLKTFTREIGNVKCYIDNRGIYKKEIKITFPPVYPYALKGRYSKTIHPDLFFGTLDLETYQVNDTGYVYAAGFYTNNSIKTFYIDEDGNNDSVIIKCLDAMLVEKYNRYTFYAHNFGGFDSGFIFPVVVKANTLYPNKYDYKPYFNNNGKMISLNISTKVNNKTYSIKIVDSYSLLQASLSDLCRTFNTDIKKSFFPYGFVNKNTLFYKGKKPSIEYYKDLDINTYNEIEKENWSVKDQTISYLEKDLISLYKVMDIFIRREYINYHTHVTRSLTISGLSMDIFLRSYYNNNIPLIKQKSIYNNLKKSYYGGITEVYKPYGKHLKYYDVNSLYPYSALNSMPGLNCVYVDNINKNISELLDGLFGFYYCKIIASDNYIGLLPYRSEEGLIMPLGELEGWYFSEELKFAYEKGYKIDIIRGYNFDKSENVFTKYIEELYKIKSSSKDSVERTLAKAKLNHLIGKFGLDINKFVTEIVSQEELIKILETRRYKSLQYIHDDKFLVRYGKEISPEICKKAGVDYKTLLSDMVKDKKNRTLFQEEEYHDVSVAIASAVTAYSRIYMAKIKLLILSLGGKIYYTDTDSIVTDIELPEYLVGTEIGKFKLEYEIEEGYFISNKTYGLKKYNGDIVIKTKGLFNKSLSYQDFKDLYLGTNVEAIRYETIMDLSKSSVAINIPKAIQLSASSYTKRSKIFNNKRLWVDTKPLYIKFNEYHTYKKFNIPFLYNIKNVIVWIFLGILISILYIISCSFSELPENDNLNDIENIELNNTINISNNKDSSFESVTNSDTENSFFIQQFYNFIKLFKKKYKCKHYK